MAKSKYSFQTNFVAGTVFGLCLGVFLSTWCRNKFIPCAPSFSRTGCCTDRRLQLTLDLPAEHFSEQKALLPDESQTAHKPGRKSNNVIIEEADEKGFIFVGVMTAQKYLDSRAVASFNTWGKNINGKVMFFSSEGSTSNYDIPIVSLKNVDDSYPPQKKSFMMLKYMHEHYLGKYEWFLRADDDVFVKWDKLERFLRSINSSQPHFIGQAGIGTKEEIGLLSLGNNENYCMGGPGVVFSQETMRKVGPHLGFCVHNLFTSHEDVEIGRCVRQFAGIPCTWSFEMQKLFYQNFKEDKGAFINTLKDKAVERTITMHPIKIPAHQYRIHNHIRSMQISDFRQKELLLQREIYEMDQVLNEQKSSLSDPRFGYQPSVSKYVPSAKKDILSWEFIAKTISSHRNLNPRKGLNGFVMDSVAEVTSDVILAINQNSRQRGRTIDFKELLYGYLRSDPLHGADYILDLLLTFRKHKGKSMTAAVRRHVYLHQTFTQTEFIESPMTSPKSLDLTKSSHIYRHLHGDPSDVVKLNEAIHFILPLSGKVQAFDKFMKIFETICLKRKENVHLHVVLFTKNSFLQEVEDILRIVGYYQKKYGGSLIEVIEAEGDFARGKALALGAKQCSASDLLFFVDVDILLTPDSLIRLRLNTIQGTQVYYPIVFSQYDPDTICADTPREECKIQVDDFVPKMGYWRQFGYGIAAMYRSDLDMVGGYDTNIEGWGKEDVDLFDRFIDSNLTVFRSVDTGMVHAFHLIHCDPNLEPAQLTMCIGSKATCLGSQQQLAQIVFSTPDIFNRKIPS